MHSERLSTTDSCSLSRRWSIAPALADMLLSLEARAQEIFSAQGIRWPGLFIISGYRSARLQAELNPAAPLSLHRFCPSLAVNLRVADISASLTPTFWPFLGTIWKAMGGRWGGDFRPEPDVNHFELPAVTVAAVRRAAAAGVA